MGYLDSLEKAFSSSGDEDLRIKSTETKAKQVLELIRKKFVGDGLFYFRSVQSAMYDIGFYEKPIKTVKDSYGNKRLYAIDGWHGAGKGNRNYGEGFTVFTFYDTRASGAYPEFKLLDVTKDIADNNADFKSGVIKAKYLNNLDKLQKAILQNKIDSLF